MDFRHSEEQLSFYKSVKDFAAQVVEPGAHERDVEGRFDRKVWDALGEFGLLGLPIPEEYGGSGADIISTCLALEAPAEGGHDAGLGLSVGAHITIGTVPIWLHGNEEQKRRYLPKLCTGEHIGAMAITEPEAGSDAGAIKARARKEGDDWIKRHSAAAALLAQPHRAAADPRGGPPGEREGGRRRDRQSALDDQLHAGVRNGDDPKQEELAERLVKAPQITALVAQGPHVPQPIERVNGKLVVFSEGNLISNQGADVGLAAESQDGYVALLDLVVDGEGARVSGARYVPTWVDHLDYRVLPVGPALEAEEADPASLRASYERTVGIVGREAARPVPRRLP
jgi:Acyl-CoA dehydrogenase, N-terminal domain/Bacterial capsule synthesis protein PGA_cap